ncbi:LPXTG-domain-containing protein cell wall anchor domain-containing protein [Streptomyces sp. SPB074]|nr:LPXTG-domain-containing protein cell wall anchor domain-containing protein [Streptomyces sp. SPB074]
MPLDVSLNASGNTVGVVALLDPALGNSCGNGTPAPEHPAPRPPGHVPPPHVPPHHVPPHHVPRQTPEGGGRAEVPPTRPQLAETGADAGLLGVVGASATLLVGGAILYRRRPVPAHR